MAEVTDIAKILADNEALASFAKTVIEAAEKEEQPTSEAKLHQHLESARAAQQARNQPTQKGGEIIQLPLFPVDTKGVPNSILRSALFAAVQDRRALERELLAVQDGIEIRFTGWQLNQSDLDVWEQALQLANEHPLGTRCDFTARGFLKALKKGTGKSQHEWLKGAFARLAGAVVEIKHNGKAYFGTLLEGYRDDKNEIYRIEINPKLKALYDAGFTLTDWEQRKKLGRKPLAKWLHGFLASHAKPRPLKVETYMRLSGSSTNKVKHFRENLIVALDELLKVNAIKSYEITEGGLVKIQRKPSRSQKRHLTRARPRKERKN